MKRELLQNAQVAPYTSGAVVNRMNFLSMIFAAAVTAAGALTLTVEHCDTEGGTFEAVTDTHIAPHEGAIEGGVISITAAAGDTVQVDIDLVGCKQFVTITASGAAASGATYAFALGDPEYAPV